MTEEPPRVYVLAPTYREPAAVAGFLRVLTGTEYANWRLLLTNSCPGDETSHLLRAAGLGDRVRELEGHAGLYWSGAQNVGLREVLKEAADGDLVLLANVDTSFGPDTIGRLVEAARLHPRSQLGALACSRGRVISSGVRIRSWMLALTGHPFAGWPEARVPVDGYHPVDLLPTRCVLVPVEAVRRAGLIREKWLPHYGADYEYTGRLARHGYPAVLCLGIRIESDVGNTGNTVYRKPLGLKERFRRLFNVKSPYNPFRRLLFVALTYPWWAVPTAGMMYLLKTALEVCLGGAALRRLLPGKEHGFS